MDEFEVVWGPDRASQLEWMRSLRSQTAQIEMVFHNGDDQHPFVEELAWLNPHRQVGVDVRPGYERPQPKAVLHRYPYDRAIIRALVDLGGFFVPISSPHGDRVEYTGLGNVDITFLDQRGVVLGATVTHEGLILMPATPLQP